MLRWTAGGVAVLALASVLRASEMDLTAARRGPLPGRQPVSRAADVGPIQGVGGALAVREALKTH